MKRALIGCLAVGFWLFGNAGWGWSQSNPPAPAHAKTHKWKGSLVDAVCMASALSKLPALDSLVYQQALSQYYFQHMQGTPTPAQGNGPGMPTTPGPPPVQDQAQQGESNPPERPTGALDPGGEPETSQRELDWQAAQLRRADAMNRQARMCTPGTPTRHFALLVADGQLLKFDARGDMKTLKALKASAIPPGKMVKAEVKGRTQEPDTVTVASIQIKGEIPATDNKGQISQSLFEWRPYTPWNSHRRSPGHGPPPAMCA